MVSENDLHALIAPHVKRVLDYAGLSVPSDKYPLLRTLILDEFRHSGLRKELAEFLSTEGQSGK